MKKPEGIHDKKYTRCGGGGVGGGGLESKQNYKSVFLAAAVSTLEFV